MSKFPSRATHKTLIQNQEVDFQGIEKLSQLADAVEEVVRSDDFIRKVVEEKWNTIWGHCAVATAAMQILAWQVYGIYLDTYNAPAPNSDSVSHWFLSTPEGVLIDPTAYQFEDADYLTSLYQRAIRKGHPSRRSLPPFTNSPPVKYIIQRVTEKLL